MATRLFQVEASAVHPFALSSLSTIVASVLFALRTANLFISLGLLALVALAGGPRLLGWQAYIVYSDSMAPSVPMGSVVVVQPQTVANLAVGDIITFSQPSQPELPMTHRVVAVSEIPGGFGWRVMTKGDSNPEPDTWSVEDHQVVGRTVFSVPFVGYVLDWIVRPFGKFAILGFSLVAFVVHIASKHYLSRTEAPSDRKSTRLNSSHT